MPRHFLDLFDVDAARGPDAPRPGRRAQDAALRPARPRRRAKTLGLIFEKPSLRTRVSFEAAMTGLGGPSTFLRGEDVGLGVRESVRDFARVISQYVDALAIRTFCPRDGRGAGAARRDPGHQRPLRRRPPLPGDGRPADRPRGVRPARRGRSSSSSSATATTWPARWPSPRPCSASRSSWPRPPAYDFPAAFRVAVRRGLPGASRWSSSTTPARAVAGAQVVYTDVWASMGQEAEAAVRRLAFEPVSGQRRPLRPRRPRGDLPPLPPRPPRRGGHRRRARHRPEPGHPPGRQPAPLPEGPARLAIDVVD